MSQTRQQQQPQAQAQVQQQPQHQQHQQQQYQQQPQQQQPQQISQAHLQQSQQQYQQHQARMQQQQRELQQAAQAQPASNRNSQQPAQQQQALGTQALHGGPQSQPSSTQNRSSSQKVPQPTIRPVQQTQHARPTQQQLQKPLPSQPQAQQHTQQQSQQHAQQQSQQQSKEQYLRSEQAHVNQQPFFRPHESASHQSRQAAQGSPVAVPARSSSIKRTGATQTTTSSHTSQKSGNTPLMSWLTVLGFLALGLAIFVKDPLHRRTTKVHYPKDHGGDKGQTPIGDSERLNAWKHVPVKELRVDESFWNKDKPFDWPHAKRLVVFGDETVSSAAGNAHGHPTGLDGHKGLRWTDYLYKSFMDDDALYHNLATVGSNAADIDSQIKAFQSMNTVQGSKFNADDTLFVIGSGEAAVKPLDGSAAKACAVTAQVNDLMKRAEQLWSTGGRSFLFVGLREAGDDGRAREHWNAELGTALNKFKKAHPAANVMLFRYGDWFDAVRANPDLVGITECKREIEPNTDGARLGYCIDTFGDETWPLDRLLSHAINGYLVKHSRAAGGKKAEASGGKHDKHGRHDKHGKHGKHDKKHDKKDSRRKGKMGSKSK